MERVFLGQKPDRTPFVPSIYEHGAAVLGTTPSRASTDTGLMADAVLESYGIYRHDLVTVGIDIYNIEAEAFGCTVKRFEDNSIPAVAGHPLADMDPLDPRVLPLPSLDGPNRLGLITEACRKVVKEIGGETVVFACTGGPFSQAVELRGFERLLMDMMEAPERVHALLEKTSDLSVLHARRLSETGAGINLYESWATLPLISPDIFRDFVVPYNKKVIAEVRKNYRTPPPAVIMGGNTSLLIDFFIDAKTSLVAADYNTDFPFIRRRIEASGEKIVVRGCLDPKMIERGDWENLDPAIIKLSEKARGMNNFVWGCGCVSYDTGRENLLRFKESCLAASKE
jgi:uroporphyrinogen decarboxylase